MFTVDAGDVTLSADTRGRGPDALLVHGTFMSRRVFDGVREALADRLTTTAFDLRGHGESTAPRGARYALDEYASDLARVVEELDGPVTLLGWSLGAKTVLQYLHREGAADVERAILVSSGVLHELSDEDERPAPYLDFAAFRRRVYTDWPELADDFVDLLAGEELGEPTRRWLWQVCVDTPIHVARAHVDDVGDPDLDALRAAVAESDVPVSVFHGAHDRAASVSAARTVAELGGGSCRIFEESAHFPFLAEPERFTAALLEEATR